MASLLFFGKGFIKDVTLNGLVKVKRLKLLSLAKSRVQVFGWFKLMTLELSLLHYQVLKKTLVPSNNINSFQFCGSIFFLMN